VKKLDLSGLPLATLYLQSLGAYLLNDEASEQRLVIGSTEGIGLLFRPGLSQCFLPGASMECSAVVDLFET